MEKQKLSFFKRVIISIKDFEKYDIFALEDFKESIKYLFIILLIFSFIATIVYGYKFMNGGIEEIVTQAKNELGETFEIDVEQMQDIMEQNYIVFIVIIFFSLLLAYFCSTFLDSAMLALLGIIVARMLNMKIKFKSTLNIGIHALTLPLILQIIYIVINELTGFEIKYFQWMYVTISYIYVVVAILMIKTEFINQQRELIKIQLEQEKIKMEMQEQNNENKEDKEKEENKKEDKKEKEKNNEPDNNLNEEPEGNNA